MALMEQINGPLTENVIIWELMVNSWKLMFY